ncbi:MAG: glycolate oxidase subunit GlcE [Burkholderiales bacterium]|nr:glycolate oxidase subunit GlcE [Burkholderiales bacterium]
MEPALESFGRAIREAAASRRPLCIRGGGSKDFYGQAPAGEPLEVRGHAGVTAFEPSELVVTARCGTPLAELEEMLARAGQMFAFEPPHFAAEPPAGATFGGMIAAGLSGPRRAAAGAVRDYLLGARIMNGRGEVLGFGGQVMKNVAGYDVARLAAGSLGTLGIIVEASVKTLPRPSAEVTLALEMPGERALESVNRWIGRGIAVSASAWRGGELAVRLSGAASAVAAAAAALGGERIPEASAAARWAAIRDHRDAFFAGEEPLWRLSLPQLAPSVDLPGEQLIEWAGALRWLRSGADPQAVRTAAARAGGHATLFRGGDKASGVFHPLPAALLEIQRRLKAVFDPDRVFNPGRMYPGI